MKPMNLNDVRFAVRCPKYELFIDPLIEDLEAGRSHGTLLMDLLRMGQKDWVDPEDDGGPDPARFHCVGPDEAIDQVIIANRGSIIAAVVKGIHNGLQRCCTGDDHKVLEKILLNLEAEDRFKNGEIDDLPGQGGLDMLTFRYLNTLQSQLDHIRQTIRGFRLSSEGKRAVDANIGELDEFITTLQGRLYKAFWERFPFERKPKTEAAQNWKRQPGNMTDDIARTFSREDVPVQAGPARVQPRQDEEKKE